MEHRYDLVTDTLATLTIDQYESVICTMYLSDTHLFLGDFEKTYVLSRADCIWC